MLLEPPAERAESLTPDEREWFGRAIEALNRRRVPFLIAGAFGLYHYTGFWRNTKDLDVLILPEHREPAIEAVTGAGLEDLFPQEPYDREWIFRSTRGEVIVDLIWRLANKADDVQPGWFDRASEGKFMGQPVRYASAADLCWMKLFVLQRNRCDWTDILNVIRGTEGRIDWNHLLREAGEHWRLLAALVNIYDWLCPAERGFIPPSFRAELDRRLRLDEDAGEPCRRDLLDSRPWLTDPGAGFSHKEVAGTT